MKTLFKGQIYFQYHMKIVKSPMKGKNEFVDHLTYHMLR